MNRRRLNSGEIARSPMDDHGANQPDIEAGAVNSVLRGFVDSLSPDGITGWVLLRSDPSYRCIVVLKEGDRFLGQAEASQFRGDLQSAGVGDGCHAFRIDMPAALLEGEEHVIDLVEQRTGASLTGQPIAWAFQPGGDAQETIARPATVAPASAPSPAAASETDIRLGPLRTRDTVLFDVSDLVYYIGHHANLTGIQRVQSGIVMSVIEKQLLPPASVMFVSFDAAGRRWVVVPTPFFITLLRDLFAPENRRVVKFSAQEARTGTLPGAYPFVGSFNPGAGSVLCLLGAAWVQQDYFHRVLALKREFGTRFVMMVHDLIPIYARHTCDQGTVAVFEAFMRRALRHVDHYLSVSENTASDLRRYAREMGHAEPTITVTRNGSSFDEFMPPGGAKADAADLPGRYVLFVSTIEGRKNHKFVLDLWKAMAQRGDDVPTLVCVGRVGWRSEAFVAELVESDYLDGKVLLLQEVSDSQLHALYQNCLFTLYPSLYEGWGLPVGESLAAGKVCITSDRSSIPEVGGDLGVYIDIDDLEASLDVVRAFATDAALRARHEARIRAEYRPTSWAAVATSVVSSLKQALRTEWAAPYPAPLAAPSAEISFASISRHAEASMIGPDLLTRITETRRGYFLYDTLREDSFLTGEDARAGGAWAEPETWGTWLCHDRGSIALGVPGGGGDQFVFLRLRASGGIDASTVTIKVGKQLCWSGSLGPRSQNISLRVHRQDVTAGGLAVMKLDFAIALTADQRRSIAALDARVPTLGLERLLIVPSADLATRLDVLTRLIS